jgi:fucose permease
LGLSIGAIALRGSQRSAATSTEESTPAPARLPLRAAPALAALGLVTFAYVGVESGLTLFAVPWAVSRGEPEQVGQWGISTFWFGLLIGRLSLVIRRGDGDKGLQLLAASSFAGAAIVCLSSALALGPLVLVMTLAGIVLGPVYPVTISLAANRVPTAAATALGLVAATGACGGFAIPWLTGAVGDSSGVPLAMTLLGAYALLIAVAAIALFQRDARLQRVQELARSR